MADPLEDITTRPTLYRSFAGRSVRIKPFWSTRWFKDDQKAVLKQSLRLIDNAEAVLKKYTLALDYGELSPNLFGIVRVGIPKGNPAVLDFDATINLPVTGRPSGSAKDDLKQMYDLTQKARTDEDRLIVVFTPLAGPNDTARWSRNGCHGFSWIPAEASAHTPTSCCMRSGMHAASDISRWTHTRPPDPAGARCRHAGLQERHGVAGTRGPAVELAGRGHPRLLLVQRTPADQLVGISTEVLQQRRGLRICVGAIALRRR